MSLYIEKISDTLGFRPAGFDLLKEAYTKHQPTADDYIRYGKYAIANTSILKTPSAVLANDEILTNPSQIETENIFSDGILTTMPFAYFRQEPTSFHLGKTKSVPYLLLRNSRHEIYLSEFIDAMTLPGEDPRVIKGVKIAGPTGKVHSGWCISTVVATPKPEDPADVESIKQVFYWGESLSKLEPIVEIADLKNTCPFPLANITHDDSDTSVDVFGRPHPHITHSRASSLTRITKELVLSGTNITEGFLPADIHTGVNTVKEVLGYPDLRELDIHEAYAPATPEGKVLHYRLGRYGIDLSTGKLTPLGVIATRADFPEAEAKPPENGVKEYNDVLYGSMGNPKLGMMVTGMSDRNVGLAEIIQVEF
ncbi:MAG: hypothetical protein NVSMB46_04100 [Candidatus Saccharimonadales bacterium]